MKKISKTAGILFLCATLLCSTVPPKVWGTQLKQEADKQEADKQEAEEQSAKQQAEQKKTSKNQTDKKEVTKQKNMEQQADLGLQSKSVVLMEADTGTILYEKNPDERLSPASITKIMTLILIFDAIEQGKIKMDDMVTTSAYAKSMGGSQVFLEEGEQQTVETMIKCIVIASGNDASVAMAEHLAGSETEFVAQMNRRAKELGMENTVFEDCCGLTDSTTHLTTAKDVALMSRELITKYPKILEYSGIWMDTITHVTDKGTKEFGLSNTNKLLKMSNSFQVTGLKTGSTSLAKYCLSATAVQDGISLIAVIMAAPDYKARFGEAQALLKYGYANCSLYQDKEGVELQPIGVKGGQKDKVEGELSKEFSYLSMKGEDFGKIEKEVQYKDSLEAPIHKGDGVGQVVYKLNDKELGTVAIVAKEDVGKVDFSHCLWQLWRMLCV